MDLPNDSEIYRLTELLKEKPTDFMTIGLDQALAISGFSVIKGDKLIRSGVFPDGKKLTKQRDMVRRAYVKGMLEKLIEKYKPDLVIIEDNHWNGFVKSFEQLVGLRAVLENYLFELEIPCIVIAPSEWRKKIGVSNKKGVDSKKVAIEKLQELTGNTYPADEAEAILIGITGTKVIQEALDYGLEKIKPEKKKKRRRKKNK